MPFFKKRGGTDVDASAAAGKNLPQSESSSNGKQSAMTDTANQKNDKPLIVPFLKLFRFTTPTERIMMALGSFCAILHGALLPVWTIVFGDVIDSFSSTPSREKIVDEIGGVSKVCSFNTLLFTFPCCCSYVVV